MCSVLLMIQDTGIHLTGLTGLSVTLLREQNFLFVSQFGCKEEKMFLMFSTSTSVKIQRLSHDILDWEETG